MPPKQDKSPKVAKAAGGAKPKKPAKPSLMFAQATSLAGALPSGKTGNLLQFTHGQRAVRKATPDVNGCLEQSRGCG